MVVDNPDFKQPKNGNGRLWRYMSIPKFLFLLNERSLYFSRSDSFNDPYEGAATDLDLLNQQNRRKEFILYCEENGIKYNPNYLSKVSPDDLYPFFRKYVAINCWHENQFESAAMWDLYCNKSEGIAVVTTWNRLKESIQDDQSIFLGRVKYIDRSKQITKENNIMNVYIQKRKSFEHEREVRAIATKFSDERDSKFPTKINTDIETITGGLAISVNLQVLIKKIYIAPTAPVWHYKLIKDIIKLYGYDFSIIQSDLYKSPI